MSENNTQSASYDPELTDGMKNVLEDISKALLKEGTGIIVAEIEAGEFRWFIEALSLMAKQVNLCDSCMLLLENGMEQEAFILARSQFNNMLWIRYLMSDDEEHSHYKGFRYQPTQNQIQQDKNLIKLLNDYGEELDPRLTAENIKEKLKERIKTNEQVLKDADVTSNRTKSIRQLAMQDVNTFGNYVTFYNESSKFEHSDVSTTQNYRKSILPNYSNASVFTFDLSKSNEQLWYKVFQYSHLSLFWAYEAIEKKIIEEETQLCDISPATNNAPYDKEELKRILLEFALVMKQYEKDTANFSTNYLDQMGKPNSP